MSLLTLALGFPSDDNPACEVTMTKRQAALIARACAVLLDVGDAESPLSEDERDEVNALREMALEIDHECINGWCV